MKHYAKKELDELEKLARVNLINSISGYKPANLIGTISGSKQTNLAIFSSVVHLGTNPPLFGFITRPPTAVPRHTYENLKETGVYTINHVHESFVRQAHYTSAKLDREISEFAACGLTEEYVEGFAAPFVAESRIKFGLKLVEEIPIKLNGTILIVGELEHLLLPENARLENGAVNLNAVADVCISGLDTYHRVAEITVLPLARADEIPEFNSDEKSKPTFNEAEISRIVGMTWEDRTTFDVIKDQFGISEAEVIKIMRANMKPSSFRMWRERVHGRKTKHRAKAEKEMDRFVSPDQRHRDKTY